MLTHSTPHGKKLLSYDKISILKIKDLGGTIDSSIQADPPGQADYRQ